MKTHTLFTLSAWCIVVHYLFALQIICHLAFPSSFLSLVFCWLFNRKQRQQPLGSWWKTQLTVCCCAFNVCLLLYSLLTQSKCHPRSTKLYLLCSAVAKSDLCSSASAAGFEPTSSTHSSQDITKSQQPGRNQFNHGKSMAAAWTALGSDERKPLSALAFPGLKPGGPGWKRACECQQQ